MALLYIAAEARELTNFAERLTGLRPLKWPLDYAQEGILDDRRILLAANGPGPKLAAQALEIAIRAISAADLQSSALEGVISTGFCGALRSDLVEGQIVVGTEVLAVATNEKLTALDVETEQPFLSGTLVSQDRVASTATEKAQLAQQHDALAVEMEAFGVAARAKRAGLPFYCIKVVSDRADESLGIDFNRSRSADGRFSRVKIVLQAIARPNLIPELFRLRGRAEMAARALGDFLVSCRYVSQSASSVSQVEGKVEGE